MSFRKKYAPAIRILRSCQLRSLVIFGLVKSTCSGETEIRWYDAIRILDCSDQACKAQIIFGQSMHLLLDKNTSEELIRSELAKAGIPKADIRPIAPSLEDVFVALTKDREQH